eukprot:GHVN01011560.1.p1 GENE.GHVN01011560.1~~GHVN01011560.1.p1  ORF type:complete len:216 (-),score=34.99 GHVN01011560.1:135-782(-)
MGVSRSGLNLRPEYLNHWRLTVMRIIQESLDGVVGGLLSPCLSCDSETNPTALSAHGLLSESVMETIEYLRVNYGPKEDSYRWGRVRSKVFFEHNFANVNPLLRRILSVGPLARGGSGGAIQANRVGSVWVSENAPWTGREFASSVDVPVMRMVVDLGDLPASRWLVPPGASGWAGTSHYSDQAEAHTQGLLYPMLWSDEDVMAASTTLLRLERK